MTEDWREKANDYPWVDFKTGSFQGRFLGGEDSTNKWGPCVKFKFETEDGKPKALETSSKRLIGMMANIPDGTLIKIGRTGVSTETVYDVSVIEKPTLDYLNKINEGNKEKETKEAATKEAEEMWDEA